MRRERKRSITGLAAVLVLACILVGNGTALAMQPGEHATCLADYLLCHQQADDWLGACIYGCMQQIDDPIQEARCELNCGDGYAIVTGACYAEYLSCLALGN